MERLNFITLPRSVREEIAKEMGVTHQTVWLALRYSTHSQMSVKIREEAIKRGGEKTFKYV